MHENRWQNRLPKDFQSPQPPLDMALSYFTYICKKNFFSVCLGLHPWHMEVPRLGVKMELYLLAYTTATGTGIPSATHTTAHSNARSLTH